MSIILNPPPGTQATVSSYFKASCKENKTPAIIEQQADPAKDADIDYNETFLHWKKSIKSLSFRYIVTKEDKKNTTLAQAYQATFRLLKSRVKLDGRRKKQLLTSRPIDSKNIPCIKDVWCKCFLNRVESYELTTVPHVTFLSKRITYYEVTLLSLKRLADFVSMEPLVRVWPDKQTLICPCVVATRSSGSHGLINSEKNLDFQQGCRILVLEEKYRGTMYGLGLVYSENCMSQIFGLTVKGQIGVFSFEDVALDTPVKVKWRPSQAGHIRLTCTLFVWNSLGFWSTLYERMVLPASTGINLVM